MTGCIRGYFETRPLSRRDEWMLGFSSVIIGAAALYLLVLLFWYVLMRIFLKSTLICSQKRSK